MFDTKPSPQNGRCLGSFGILIHYFMQQPSYLLRCTPPTPPSWSFLLLLTHPSLKCLGAFWVQDFLIAQKDLYPIKKTSFPITFGGIGLILTTTIIPTTYLRDQALQLQSQLSWLLSINVPSFLWPWLEFTTTPSLSINTSKQRVIFYHPQFTRVFFHLKNSSCNKWFGFKIPSQNVYTIIPFSTCSLIGYPRPIVLEFYHVIAQGRAPCLQFKLVFLTF